MKDFTPKVSIVIPVYNGANFLNQAIDSALSQTYQNIEVVVVNDGSADNGETDKVAKSYGDKIVYFTKENGGVASALNFGIAKMQGEYFSWLSHDDMYEKNKIEEQIRYLESANDKNTIVACNVKVLFKSGVKKREYIDKPTFDYVDIFLSTSAVVGINGCSLLIPRAALIETGGFNENMPVTQDYDLWFRLCKQYRFHLVERHLVISRRHDGQDSVQKQKMCFEAAEELHYGFLREVPYERFKEFFAQEGPIVDNYLVNYRAYKNGGYKKTASMMLKHLLDYYAETDPLQFETLYSVEVGPLPSPQTIIKPKTKPRIIIFSSVWHMGGIERVISHMFTRFADKYEFILVTVDVGEDIKAGYPLPPSVQWLKINDRNQLAELMNVIALLEADLFIGNPNFSAPFIDIYPLLKGTKTKTIAYNHGHYFLPYTTGNYLYPTAIKIKESYKSADYVIWLSEVACNIYNLENDNGLYIANPVQIEEGQRPKAATGRKLLSVGRFDDEVKQIDKILLLFKALHNIDPDYQLDIVGYCPMSTELPRRGHEKLHEFIHKQKIPVENITFWGEQDDVTKFYDAANFLLLTSRSEGFALVLVEALSRAVPCAVLEYLGVEEIVQNGLNGWVCEQDDIDGLADDINRTLTNERQYVAMSENAIHSVRKYEKRVFYKKWGILLDHIFSSLSDKELELLKPSSQTRPDYKKIILEYEKMLNVLVTELLNDAPKKESRLRTILKRLKLSIERDGLRLTAEKGLRKVHSKLSIKRQIT